ncbi:MAG: hypothetical protein HGA87_01600 [Desulfobulbaceae bacterium]|nr:hypothetical protein [Desulfobulbaceae bacterium]
MTMKRYFEFERNLRSAESLLDEKVVLMGELGCIRKLREELQEADEAAKAYDMMLCSPTGSKEYKLMLLLYTNLARELADVDIAGRRTYESDKMPFTGQFKRAFKAKVNYVLNSHLPRVLDGLRQKKRAMSGQIVSISVNTEGGHGNGPCSSPAGDCDGLCDTCVFNPANMAGDGDA